MTWSAFFNALRTGMVQRGGATATRRTGAVVQANNHRATAARSTSTQAARAVRKKKTIEDWDYRCIDLAMAWH